MKRGFFIPVYILALGLPGLNSTADAQSSGAFFHINGAFRAEHQTGVGSSVGNGFENVTFAVENDPSNPDTTLWRVVSQDGRDLFRVDDDGHVFMPHLERAPRNDHFVQIEGGQLYRYKPFIELMNDVRPYRGNTDLLLEAELKTWKGIGDEADQYGIGYIAEEVDALGLTDLVVYHEDGQPEGLAVALIPAFLTRIVQQHHTRLAEREAQLTQRAAEIRSLRQTLTDLQARLEALETRSR